MDNQKEVKTEIVRHSYDYMFLLDIFEMLRGYCYFLHSDKKLSTLFTDLLEYLNSQIPNIEGEIIDYELFATVKK